MTPESEPEVWLGMANALGAVLNNAARLAVGEGRDALLAEGIAALSAAQEVASRHNSVHDHNLKTNLATAIRLQSLGSGDRRDSLSKAIEYRLQVVRSLDSDSNVVEAGNALDSLGNDYAALATSGDQLDLQAFEQSLIAYRKALVKRPRATFLVNWARTQYNIGSLYLSAARLEIDDLRRRRLRSARSRLTRALAALSKEEAPQDWLAISLAYVRAMLWLLQEGEEVPDEGLVDLAVALEEAAAFADQVGNFECVIGLLELQLWLAAHVYVKRMPSAIDMLDRASRSIEGRRHLYRDTPIAELIDIVYAQVDVMLGHLTADGTRAKRGVQLAMECKDRATAKGREWLTVEIEGVLGELCEVVTTMEVGAVSG